MLNLKKTSLTKLKHDHTMLIKKVEMYGIKVVWYPLLTNKQNTVYFNNT